MMKAIDAALVKAAGAKPRAAETGPEPIRVVCFMTDGYVGNDMEIIDAVKKNAGTTRVFSFGIGSSVNRFLLDGMARAGRGEVEYVTLDSNAEAAAERFYKRIDAPVLTDVAIDWGGLPVADVYPKQAPDLFSAKPVVVHGRLTGEVKPGAAITLRGHTAGGAFERKVELKPAPQDASHEALASIWARSKVADVMSRDLAGLQSGTFPDPAKQEITALGVEFRLVTQFTSFVAVEELTITRGGKPTTISVPVEMPSGVSYDGIFGEQPAMLGRGGVAMGGAGGSPGMVQQQMARGRGALNTTLYLRAARPAPAPAPESLSASASASAPVTGSAGPVKKEQLAEAGSSAGLFADAAAAPAAPDPLQKLDGSLRGLAGKVAKEGKDGTLAAGAISVSGYRVDVMIRLSDSSPKTLEALKKLGFEVSAESKAIRLVVGSIDVRKLAELAKLEAVVSVRPVGP